MANRAFRREHQALEPSVVELFARLTFGASGAPTIDTSVSKGIASVVRNSTGKYTFTFGITGQTDTYRKLLCLEQVWDQSGQGGASPAGLIVIIFANNVATGTLQIQVVNSSGTAVDPASGDASMFQFTLSNSSAG